LACSTPPLSTSMGARRDRFLGACAECDVIAQPPALSHTLDTIVSDWPTLSWSGG
jgi:hypothetical protein